MVGGCTVACGQETTIVGIFGLILTAADAGEGGGLCGDGGSMVGDL